MLRCEGNKGIDVDKVLDGKVVTPLGHAILRHDKEMVDALLKLGANPMLRPVRDRDAADPAWLALSECQPEIFASLLEQPGVLSSDRAPSLLSSFTIRIGELRGELRAELSKGDEAKPEVIESIKKKLHGMREIGHMILQEGPISGTALNATILEKDPRKSDLVTFKQLITSGKFTPTGKGGTRGDNQAVTEHLDFHLYNVMQKAIAGRLPPSYLELCIKHQIVPLTKVSGFPTAAHSRSKSQLNAKGELSGDHPDFSPVLFAMDEQNLEALNALRQHGKIGPKQLDEESPFECALTQAAMMGKPVLMQYRLGLGADLDRMVRLDLLSPSGPKNKSLSVHNRLKKYRGFFQDFLNDKKVPEPFQKRYEAAGGEKVQNMLTSLEEGLAIIEEHKKQQQSAG